MKFSVELTSDCTFGNIPLDATPPLPGCVLEKRTKIIRVRGGYWPDTGKPYFIDKECPDDRWIIKIDTLEDLMDILDSQNNSFIISKSGENYPDCPHIEIYNSYRE